MNHLLKAEHFAVQLITVLDYTAKFNMNECLSHLVTHLVFRKCGLQIRDNLI